MNYHGYELSGRIYLDQDQAVWHLVGNVMLEASPRLPRLASGPARHQRQNDLQYQHRLHRQQLGKQAFPIDTLSKLSIYP